MDSWNAGLAGDLLFYAAAVFLHQSIILILDLSKSSSLRGKNI